MLRERRTFDLLYQECVKSYPSGLRVNPSSKAGNLLAGNWERRIWDHKTLAQGPVVLGGIFVYSPTVNTQWNWDSRGEMTHPKSQSYFLPGLDLTQVPWPQNNACLAFLPLSTITNKGDCKCYGNEFIWRLYSTFITSEWFLFFPPLYKQLQWPPIYADKCFEDEICYKAYKIISHQQGFLT